MRYSQSKRFRHYTKVKKDLQAIGEIMLVGTKMEYSKAKQSRGASCPHPCGALCSLYEDTYPQRLHAEACLTLHVLGQSGCFQNVHILLHQGPSLSSHWTRMVMSDEFLILYFSTDLTQEKVLWHYLAQEATAKTEYNRKP